MYTDTPTNGPVYEDISDPEDEPTVTEQVYIVWEPQDFEPGRTSTYLILEPEYQGEIVTLENWDKRPASLQMYLTYEDEILQLYGLAGVLQLQQEMELYGVTWENFGTLTKYVFDDRFVCLD